MLSKLLIFNNSILTKLVTNCQLIIKTRKKLGKKLSLPPFSNLSTQISLDIFSPLSLYFQSAAFEVLYIIHVMSRLKQMQTDFLSDSSFSIFSLPLLYAFPLVLFLKVLFLLWTLSLFETYQVHSTLPYQCWFSQNDNNIILIDR